MSLTTIERPSYRPYLPTEQETEDQKVVTEVGNVDTLLQSDGHTDVLENLIRRFAEESLPTAREVSEYRGTNPEAYEQAKEQYTVALQRAIETDSSINAYFVAITKNLAAIDPAMESPYATFNGIDAIENKEILPYSGDLQAEEFAYLPNYED